MLQVEVDPAAGGDVAVLVRGELDAAGAARLRAAITALLRRLADSGYRSVPTKATSPRTAKPFS